MSEATNFDSNDPSQVGQTSSEAEDSGSKKRSLNVWDAMLLVSLLCICLACILLVLELRTFSDFPSSFPWNVGGSEIPVQ